MGHYPMSHMEHNNPSHFWIGYQTDSNAIEVMHYSGEEYYTGWGIRKELIGKGIKKTTTPFVAHNANEALDIAYLRILI